MQNVTGHVIKVNGYPTDYPENVEFTGRLLVDDHVGFRGEAKVYQTDTGRLVFMYQNSLVPGLVVNDLPDLNAAARLAYRTYPDFDPELLEKVAKCLGVKPPSRRLG